MKIDTLYYRDGFKAIVEMRCECESDIRPEGGIITSYYEIHKNGLLVAKERYAYDFATYALDTEAIKRASLFHDIVCQAIAEGHLDAKWQVVGDKLLRDIYLYDLNLIESRFKRWIGKIRAKWVYRAVREYQTHKKRIIFEEHPIKRFPPLYSFPMENGECV